MKANSFTQWVELPKPRSMRVIYELARDGWVVGIRGSVAYGYADLAAVEGNPTWRHELMKAVCAARRASRSITSR